MADLRNASVTAIRIRQWLPGWDKFDFDPKEQQAKPEPFFFMFSLRASYLKALTGVYRRSAKSGTARALDPNVQRGHEEERSERIREFVKNGYPWCEMTEAKRNEDDANSLKKPGWLPTAIIVNILKPRSMRNGVAILSEDTVKISENRNKTEIILPSTFSGVSWTPKSIFPLEVIDGQHRLWAFEDYDPKDDFELPVVAFTGLDNGWQAYLFWSINITPKKINRSLAFDLYPLLRQQTWLDRFAGHSIYRETRCQELVETLWAHPESPWHDRINMLGEKREDRDYKGASVTQAAWIRSLMATFVKQWEGRGTKIGGLFGASYGQHKLFLEWSRPMQAAFLIYAGREMREQIEASKEPWARHLRSLAEPSLFKSDDAAFYGEHSLLTTDQGIRGILSVINDLCYIAADDLDLSDWQWELISDRPRSSHAAATDERWVSSALKSLGKTSLAEFVQKLCHALAKYDWRTSSTPGLTDEQRRRQSVYRGSSGYKELRLQLVTHLANQSGLVGSTAKKVLRTIRS